MEKSKESARKVLHELLAPVQASTEDRAARALLTPELIDRIFEEAWFGQFAASRSSFKEKVREIIADTIRT